MSDDVSEDGVGMPMDDAAGAASDARVRAALTGAGPMPADVWARLSQTLSEEAAARVPAAAVADVVPLAPRRRRTPLLAGLVAAAAAVVAVAVITPQLTGGSGGDLVATAGSPVASPAMLMAEAAPPADAPAAAPAPDQAAPAPDEAAPLAKDAPPTDDAAAPSASPRSRSEAPFAARQVMRTGTDYTADTISQAVMTLVDTVDASHTRLMSSVTQEPDPTEGDSGFTATIEGLAGCLRALTASADRQALVVDRATFQGADVGIVVVPVGMAAVDPATPFDEIDIWVVSPQCGSGADTVIWHGTLSMP